MVSVKIVNTCDLCLYFWKLFDPSVQNEPKFGFVQHVSLDLSVK